MCVCVCASVHLSLCVCVCVCVCACTRGRVTPCAGSEPGKASRAMRGHTACNQELQRANSCSQHDESSWRHRHLGSQVQWQGTSTRVKGSARWLCMRSSRAHVPGTNLAVLGSTGKACMHENPNRSPCVTYCRPAFYTFSAGVVVGTWGTAHAAGLRPVRCTRSALHESFRKHCARRRPVHV